MFKRFPGHLKYRVLGGQSGSHFRIHFVPLKNILNINIELTKPPHEIPPIIKTSQYETIPINTLQVFSILIIHTPTQYTQRDEKQVNRNVNG